MSSGLLRNKKLYTDFHRTSMNTHWERVCSLKKLESCVSTQVNISGTIISQIHPCDSKSSRVKILDVLSRLRPVIYSCSNVFSFHGLDTNQVPFLCLLAKMNLSHKRL